MVYMEDGNYYELIPMRIIRDSDDFDDFIYILSKGDRIIDIDLYK